MSCRRRVCATVVTVAAFFFCCVWVVTGRAWAGDNEDARVMLFSGRDLWRNGIFVYGGLVFAPGGLEQDGLLLKVLLSARIATALKTSAASASPASRLLRNCCPAGGSNVATWN
jgi:hypothetical protein